MADARAASFATRSIKTTAKDAGLRLAMSMVDLTTLNAGDGMVRFGDFLALLGLVGPCPR